MEERINEVTVELSTKDLKPYGDNSYAVNWFDGSKKIIQGTVVKFATQSTAEAMFNLSQLLLFNPNLKTIKIQRGL